MAHPKPQKRPAPSPKIPLPANGTVIRARLDDGRWFYAQTWRGFLIIYRWAGPDDLAVEDVVQLPVAFRIAGDSGHFWAKEWKGRAEIVGVGTPSAVSGGVEESAFPELGIISRLDGECRVSRRNASRSDMHGLPLGRPYVASDIIDRLSAELAGRTWEGIAYMDASRCHLDAAGKPRPNVEPTESSLASSFHPFELFPDAPEWVATLSELDDATLAETLRTSLALDDGYIDRDEGGPAALAATVIALARSRELERILSPGEELVVLANRIDDAVSRALLDLSRTALSRVGSTESDVGSALPRSKPARAFFAAVAAALR